MIEQSHERDTTESARQFSQRFWRCRPTLCALLAGIGITLICYWLVSQNQEQKLQRAFDQTAGERTHALRQHIERQIVALHAVQSLYQASEIVEKEEFETFASNLLKRYSAIQDTGIQAISWVPRVPDSQRERFIENARLNVAPNFRITERDGDGQLVAANERAEFFPVTFLEPLSENEAAVGFDLASSVPRRHALELARDSGRVAITKRIRLVQEVENQFSTLIVAPIYRKGAVIETDAQRQEHLEGFVSIVVRIGDLLDGAFHRFNPVGVDVLLEDNSESNDERYLGFYSSEPSQKRPRGANSKFEDLLQRTSSVETFDVGGRTWKVTCAAAPTFGVGQFSPLPLPVTVLIAGTLFTLLFAGYINGLVDRSAKFERAVVDRTIRLQSEIAERKQAQDALAESEQRFRTLVQNSSDVLTILEADATIRYESPALTRMLGYEPDEVIGKSAFEFVHPDDAPQTMQGFEQCLAQPGVNVTAQFRWLHKDGSWVDLEAIGNNQLENPLVSGVMVNSRDITARKITEDQLRLQSTIVEKMNEGVLLVRSGDNSIVYTNPKFDQMMGYDPGELIGKPVNTINAGENPNAVLDDMTQVLMSKGNWFGEIENVRKDGTHRWCNVHTSVFEHPVFGNVWVSVNEDITEQKNAEDALRESEGRYRSLFNDSPISLWEVDLSKVSEVFDELREQGVTDFAPVSGNNPNTSGDARPWSGSSTSTTER